MGPSPTAVTGNEPTVFSANVAESALVNVGAVACTVSVKAWVVVARLASVAVMVTG